MSFLNKCQRKFGKYAIKNLTIYLIGAYVLGYLLEIFAPDILSYLTLSPVKVMQGQVWRLFTWIVTPPQPLGIFTVVTLFFYFSIGQLLERTLGSFLYNVYIISGLLFTVVGIMIAYLLFCYVIPLNNPYEYIMLYAYTANTNYVMLTIFLAIAVCYPDMSVLYAMIIPIKMKWLSVLYLAYVAYFFVYESTLGRVNIVMSLLSFLIFFMSTRNFRRLSPKEIKRKRNYTKQVKVANSNNIGHKCAICGITDKDAPNLTFRYCSKCSGNKEYCSDHLFTHEHS